MSHRIEIISKIKDARAKVKKEYIENLGFSGKIDGIEIAEIYTLDASLDSTDLIKIGQILSNPVTQEFLIDKHNNRKFDWAFEISFLPGVTDNIGATASESVNDYLKNNIENNRIYSSEVIFISGKLSRDDVTKIKQLLGNPLINNISTKDYLEYIYNNEILVPKVNLNSSNVVDEVNIINANDNELINIGKNGILNKDGSSRGPLSLDLDYMKAIKEYFIIRERNPTDIELESIAQTWSEHCKHTIFADPIDEIKMGLYKTYIKEATNIIRKSKGKDDFCVSVFIDNSGAIEFDKDYLITDKVETHNSPSALDPFGGSITGIGGVNRDAIGFGLGAKPILNRYGFCFANPNDDKPIFKKKGFQDKMLSPKSIMEGVIAGVNSGGNCSGIPTPQGFVYFDDRYKGKPLVFVGTVGIIPKKIGNKISYEKQALPGNHIVMVGGRVGQDGIHGATFSSEALSSGSPATAVQIGDPITQKKMSDALVKEARDLGLYTSITDNGAGGLSCSVAEMAKECGGAHVILEKIPLKYPGLEPWKIWVSESQERMTLSVPKDKWESFHKLMEKRGVEATIIGEFTNSGRCIVEYKGKIIMDLEMDFLHNGLPVKYLKTAVAVKNNEEPFLPQPENITSILHKMLARLNIKSFEAISSQYDHEVQAGSVIKPLQGRGRVNGNASVIMPILNSKKGVVVSHGINPSYSDIDTYHMAACAIDSAIRNAVCVGADPEKIALLDNFCWCSSNDPERLWELKEAVRACYDYALEYKTPFISGKDSMFNDFKGFNEKDEEIKISIPPTLLISSIGVIEDVRKCISLDAKFEGDLIYLIGDTFVELGGSEYFALIGEEEKGERYIGNIVPKVNAKRNKEIYYSLWKAIQQEIVCSALSVNYGGIAVALAKTAIGGGLGMSIKINNSKIRTDYYLFSESQGRIMVTINPKDKESFEKIMNNVKCEIIGKVRNDGKFIIQDNNTVIAESTIEELENYYKGAFGGNK